jgi:hypothetical protein
LLKAGLREDDLKLRVREGLIALTAVLGKRRNCSLLHTDAARRIAIQPPFGLGEKENLFDDPKHFAWFCFAIFVLPIPFFVFLNRLLETHTRKFLASVGRNLDQEFANITNVVSTDVLDADVPTNDFAQRVQRNIELIKSRWANFLAFQFKEFLNELIQAPTS